METDVLRDELERIRRELKTSRRVFREVASALGELWESLGGLGEGSVPPGSQAPSQVPPPQGDRPGGVVTNVPQARQAEARSSPHLGGSVFGPLHASENPGRAPRGMEEAVLRAASQDVLDTARVPRPASRTLPGVSSQESLDTARVPRPAGRTLPGFVAEDATATSRVPRPSREALQTAEKSDTSQSRDLEERPTGEFERPQRETLTYFFGADDPGLDVVPNEDPAGGGASGRGQGEPE